MPIKRSPETKKLEAILAAADVFAGNMLCMWASIGAHLTCNEAESFVHLFNAIGLNDHADALRQSHAWSDKEEDEDHEAWLDLAAERHDAWLDDAARRN